ncbi:MAG TPA: DUF2905 domain-containing protein [Pseudolabrys sp.]|nr:DUF2905 domain-containing protein [Pseudolabrys sp.]
MDMQRFLIGLGLVILAVGIVWPILSRIGVGRLPGDIVYERDGTTFYFPLVTCILISVVLSVLFWLFNRLRQIPGERNRNPRPEQKITAVSKKNTDYLQGFLRWAHYLSSC